ncbi:methylmalonyl-CoA carboxyltransferase [Platysternon megacephalum]|uniref:Methylmalonyl-CoA carboxyltransferase n=1 Tax=Platysternon megacephalum TaxID=55544 RepID=A0A4D9DN66_9SAUR|nr:methylmalonyl-CoA carboxyltransferase [Platysternon megacephalum]
MLIKSGCISAPPFPIWAARHREERKSKAKQRAKPASSLLAARLHSRDPGAAAELVCFSASWLLTGRSENFHADCKRSFSLSMEFSVSCRKELSLLDLLVRKKEVEKKGLMTEGLGACFSQTMELVANSQKTHQDDWILKNARLIIQADGSWLEFTSGNANQLLLVWYDQHKKAVQLLSVSYQQSHKPPSPGNFLVSTQLSQALELHIDLKRHGYFPNAYQDQRPEKVGPGLGCCVTGSKSQAKQTEQRTPFLRGFVRRFLGGKGAGVGDRTADLAPEPGSKLITDLHWDRTQQRAHDPSPRRRSPRGERPMEDVVNFSKGLSQTDVLRKKNELEEKGLVTEGLAACFSRAMELLERRQKPWMHRGGRLILQSDGCWVEFRTETNGPIQLVWKLTGDEGRESKWTQYDPTKQNFMHIKIKSSPTEEMSLTQRCSLLASLLAKKPSLTGADVPSLGGRE